MIIELIFTVKKVIVGLIIGVVTATTYSALADENGLISFLPARIGESSRTVKPSDDLRAKKVGQRFEKKELQIQKRDLRKKTQEERTQAVATRNAALKAAREAYLAKLKEIEKTRKNALAAARANKSKEEAKAAQEAYRKAKKEAQLQYQDAIKAANDAYKSSTSPTVQ